MNLFTRSDVRHGDVNRLVYRAFLGILAIMIMAMPLNAQNKDKKTVTPVKPKTAVQP